MPLRATENPTLDALIDDDALSALDSEDFDALPFGSIKLDGEDRIQIYNAYEAELARRDQRETIGLDFFRDVAPCTDNEIFRGRLDALVRDGKRTARFEYRFHFPWGTRRVRIQFWVPSREERWIFVLPTGESVHP